jgi:hypothetical protein
MFAMRIGDDIMTNEEKGRMTKMLFEVEGVFAFDKHETGTLDPRIEPPMRLQTGKLRLCM